MITHQFKCQSHNRSGSRHIILSYRNRENMGSLQLRALQGPVSEPIRTSLINLCFWTKYCILMNQLLINGLSMSRIPGTCWTLCNLFPACTYFLTGVLGVDAHEVVFLRLTPQFVSSWRLLGGPSPTCPLPILRECDDKPSETDPLTHY